MRRIDMVLLPFDLEVDLWSHRVRDDAPEDVVEGLISAEHFSDVEEFLA